MLMERQGLDLLFTKVLCRQQYNFQNSCITPWAREKPQYTQHIYKTFLQHYQILLAWSCADVIVLYQQLDSSTSRYLFKSF